MNITAQGEGYKKMRVKNKVKLAKAKHIVEVVYNHGILAFISRKIKKIAILIIVDLIIWIVVGGFLAPLLEPNRIVIKGSASIVQSVKADYIVSTTSRELIESTPKGKEQSSTLGDAGIEEMIRKEFGKDAERAILIAKCESRLNPSTIGDKHLIFGNGLGASYGVFQIRSGGQEGGSWSRPDKLGITLEEFEKRMLDPEQNIKYAHDIFERAGFNPWSCNSII